MFMYKFFLSILVCIVYLHVDGAITKFSLADAFQNLELSAGARYPEFDNNPIFSSHERQLTRRYLLPLTFSLKPVLDAIFSTRVTLDQDTLRSAGFQILHKQPRSFIIVAKHPLVPGYLFKIYLDDLLVLKNNRPGWKWFVYRCKGARRIAKVIHKYKIKHFIVAHKWIYPLPEYPAPPAAPQYDQKHTVLIVEEMPLLPKQENKYLWLNQVNEEFLDELYTILKHASSIRSRPDNMNFMPDGRIAIIDTEYPNKNPDYESIKKYLSPEMLAYWEHLIRNQ